MKKLFLLLILPFISIFTSCYNSNGPTDPNESLLPARVGNYWIYERFPVDSLGNVIGTPVYDTLSVIGMKEYDGRDGYEFNFKRTGLYISKAKIFSQGYHVMFYGFSVIPLYSYYSHCECPIENFWRDLTKSYHLPWKYADSVKGEEYPSVETYIDSNGNVFSKDAVMSSTSIISNTKSEKYGYKKVFVDSNTHKGITFKYEGKTFIRLITPKNAQFTRPYNNKFSYYENDRVVKVDDLNTYVTFVDNIGIVEVYEDYIYGLNSTRFKSKLIKYNLAE